MPGQAPPPKAVWLRPEQQAFEQSFANHNGVFNRQHSSKAKTPTTADYARQVMQGLAIGVEEAFEALHYAYLCDESRDEVLIESLFLILEFQSYGGLLNLRAALGHPKQPPSMKTRSLKDVEEAMIARLATRGMQDMTGPQVIDFTEKSAKEGIEWLVLFAETVRDGTNTAEHVLGNFYDSPSLDTDFDGSDYAETSPFTDMG